MIKKSLEDKDSVRTPIYFIGGTVSLALAILFLIGIFAFILNFPTDTPGGWLGNNWLIRLYKFTAGLNGFELLEGINLLDIIIMAFFGSLALMLYPLLKEVNKILSIIAIAQPFVGIIMFLITAIAGRSTVMTTVLTISIIAIWSKDFRKTTIFTGLLAGVLLLSGDITSGFGPSIIISLIVGLGYLLIMLWCILIGWQFFQLVRVERLKEKRN